jgi:hypothetical protein
MPVMKFSGGGGVVTPTQDLDGGIASSTSFTIDADGGVASTATFSIDYNGGNASFT